MANTLLQIDGKTCLIEKENDPTKLRCKDQGAARSEAWLRLKQPRCEGTVMGWYGATRARRAHSAPSPGKLVRYVVEDGDHVDAGQAYAEVEVMKMYMPLTVGEAGSIRLIMQPGAVLEAGALLGILTLDDPSRVRHARPFDGQLPKMGPPQSEDGKASSVFRGALASSGRRAVVWPRRACAHAREAAACLSGVLSRRPVGCLWRRCSRPGPADSLRTLELIFAGYDRQSRMPETVKKLLESLRTPQLPYLELQVRKTRGEGDGGQAYRLQTAVGEAQPPNPHAWPWRDCMTRRCVHRN